MINLVKIQYNPYIPVLKILINGESPSEYSQLIQFSNEEIWLWRFELLERIYAELRAEFAVVFVGTDFDSEIFRCVCEKFRYCTLYKKKNFTYGISTQKRLGILNQFLIKNHVKKYAYKNIRTIFLLDSKYEVFSEELLNIDVSNRFCKVCVEVNKLNARPYISFDENTFLFIITDFDNRKVSGLEYKTNHPIFTLCISNEDKLLDVTEQSYIYQVSKDGLLTMIFRCFLGGVLLSAMQSCIKSLEASFFGQMDIQRVLSVEPVAVIDIPDSVEVGKSRQISVSFDPPIQKKPQLVFSALNPSVAVCDGMAIYGKELGETILEVYRKGEKQPIVRKKVIAVKRNRIQRLFMDEDSFVMGEGDRHKLCCDYFPPDADNISELMWKTSDKNVALVDKYGNVQAVSAGMCKIMYIAENVSAKCICTVKPYLKEISIQNIYDKKGYITLEPGQEIELEIVLYPENCIDGKLSIESSDYDIVNVVGKTLIGKKRGLANITIRNENSRKEQIVSVKVDRKKNNFVKSIFWK